MTIKEYCKSEIDSKTSLLIDGFGFRDDNYEDTNFFTLLEDRYNGFKVNKLEDGKVFQSCKYRIVMTNRGLMNSVWTDIPTSEPNWEHKRIDNNSFCVSMLGL